MANIGLPDWVAASEADYVALAIARARDLPRLAALRAGLRARVAAAPLCDAPRFGRGLAAALRQAWRAWCDAATWMQRLPGPHDFTISGHRSGRHAAWTRSGRAGLACRGCGAALAEAVADLGLVPLSVDPVRAGTGRAVACAPLRVLVCRDCRLVQLRGAERRGA